MAGSIKRLFSFGFLFGSRDDGAVEMTEDLAEGMDSLKQNVVAVGRSSNMLQRFGNAIGAINAIQLNSIRDSLGSIADRAGALGPQAQDTGLESFGAQFSAQFRQATAGMGEFTEQMERYRGAISGTAYDLGVDANDMVTGIRQVVQAGRSLEDYGVSVRGMAGSMQAGILSGEQLGNVLTSLSEGYDLGTDGAQRLIDTVTALGERGGAGADAMRGLPAVLQATDDIISSFPAGAAPGVDTLTESITRLALASQDRLGGDFNAAMTDAIQTFQQLGGQRRQLRDLVSGVSSDFPQLAQEIGIASGDIDGALQDVMSDPLTFASHMQQLMGSLEASDPRAMRLMSTLEQMPASFRFLITGGDEAAAALTRAQQPVENVTGAFERMARGAAASGRTFGENMERLRDHFETQLNRMTTLSNREVLGRQRDAYRRLSETIDRFRSGDGPLSALGQAMLDFRRHGVIGLTAAIRDRLLPSLGIQLPAAMENALPGIGLLTEGLFEAAVEAGPLLLAVGQFATMMPGLSSAIGLVLNPWTLLIGGLAAAIYYWDDLLPLIERGGEFLGDLADDFATWVEQVDWQAVGEDIVDGLDRIFQSFGEGGSARRLMRSFAGSIRTMFGGLGQAMTGITEGMFGSGTGGFISDFFGFLFEATNVNNLLRAIEEGDWGDIIFEGLFTVLNSAMLGWPGRVRALFTEMFGGDIIGTFWNDVVQPTINDFANFWNDEILPIIEEAIILWDDLSTMAVAFWEDNVQPMLDELWDGIVKTFQEQIWPTVRRVWHDIGVKAQEMWQRYIRPALYTIARVMTQVMTESRRGWIRGFAMIAEAGVRSFYTIQTAIGHLVIRWRGWRDTLANGWNLIGTTIRNSVGMALAFANFHFTNLVQGWELGMIRIERGFRRIPLMLVEFVQEYLQGDGMVARAFRAMLDVLDISVGRIDENLGRVASDLRTPIDQMDEQIEDMERANRVRAEAYETEMTRYRNEIQEQARLTEQAYDGMNAAAERWQQSQDQSQQEAIDGVRHFAAEAERLSDRFGGRLQQFITTVQRGDFGERAQQRRIMEAYQSARPLMSQLEDAAASGRLSAEQYEAAFGRIEAAVRSGQEFSSGERRRFLDALGIDEGAAEGGGGREAPERGRRPGRTRPRSRASGDTGDDSPASRARARRQARRQAQEAEREAERELMISAFGSEAVRQLRQAFGDRNPSPRPVRSPAGSGPSGGFGTR